MKTPGWKTLTRAQQRDIKNPFVNYWYYTTYTDSAMLFRQYLGGPLCGMSGYFLQAQAPDGIYLSDQRSGAKAKAKGKLLTKVSGMSVNLAQAYAERRQAANMLTKRVHQVLMLARAVKRGHFGEAVKDIRDITGLVPKGRTAARAGKPFADNWLEFQYGWRPLLSDIYGACELIANTYHTRRPTTFVAKAKDVQPLKDTSYVSAYELTQPIRWEGTAWDTVQYVVECLEDDALLQVLASTGVTNPALLAWELLPYSFVVDWFLPVGNYLQQLEATRGLRFIRGTVSRRFECRAVGRLTPSAPGGSLQLVDVYGRVDYVASYKDRQVLSAWPAADLPTFKPNLGLGRALNGIALITQLFARR